MPFMCCHPRTSQCLGNAVVGAGGPSPTAPAQGSRFRLALSWHSRVACPRLPHSIPDGSQRSPRVRTHLSSQALTHSDSCCRTCRSLRLARTSGTGHTPLCARASERRGKPAASPPLLPKTRQRARSSWVTVSSLSPTISNAACHRGCRWPRESRSRPRLIKAAS